MSQPEVFYTTGATGAETIAVLAVLAVVYGAVLIFLFLGYLFKGFGMYRIAKANGIQNPWLSFIPVASNYLEGELAGPFTLGRKEVKRPGIWTLLTPIVSNIVLFVILFVMFGSMAVSAVFVSSATGGAVAGTMGIFLVFYFLFLLAAIALGALVQAVFGVVRFYTHLRYTDSGKAVLHMILGMMIPLYQPIYYFVLGKRQPKATEENTEIEEVTEAPSEE